jgi:hypothetical protein
MKNSMKQPNDKGLCVNCDDRLICKLHQPNQHIFFCEEYKVHSSENRRDLEKQHAFSAPIDFGVRL